jgi:hypothetical protein
MLNYTLDYRMSSYNYSKGQTWLGNLTWRLWLERSVR